MGKILFWVIVILVALVAARIMARNNARERAGAAPRQTTGTGRGQPQHLGAEPMVRCEHCGIHLPRSEALLSGGRTWCSQDHARLGAKTHS